MSNNERLYAVMTDSSRVCDRSVLARMKPARTRQEGFWTDDDPDAVWLMDRATADEIVAKLSFNNPRVVRAEKAVARIEEQRDAGLNLSGASPETPEEDDPSIEP